MMKNVFMKTITCLSYSLILGLSCTQLTYGKRYFEEVFDEVSVTEEVFHGFGFGQGTF